MEELRNENLNKACADLQLVTATMQALPLVEFYYKGAFSGALHMDHSIRIKKDLLLMVIRTEAKVNALIEILSGEYFDGIAAINPKIAEKLLELVAEKRELHSNIFNGVLEC
jgi:hypothetical protein